MPEVVDRLRNDVYAEVFDGLVMVGSSRESVNAQAARRTDNIMKHIAYHTTRWIPVSERLPDDGQEALARTSDDRRLVLQCHNRMGGCRWGHDALDADAYPLRVTHWAPLMPLPEPPATVTEQT
jgi:hypothetical protein